MAIANFFNRAAQAVSQVLQSVDRNILSEKLNGYTIAIVFDDLALENPNTRLMLSLGTNLTARFYPRISIVYDGNSAAGYTLKKELDDQALSINPAIDLVDQTHEISASLCIGTPSLGAGYEVYIDAGSWNMEVNVGRPAFAITQTAYNPFSSAAAVCCGLDEIFRFVFTECFPNNSNPSQYVLNLKDYTRELSDNLALPAVNFKDLNIVGLGAVGNALVWVLSKLDTVTGSITLIDHETVELSNLQRYILTNQNSVDLDKTVVAEEFLKRDGLKISFQPGKRFGQYVAEHRSDCVFDVIAVSVDNADDRVACQAVLPRVVLNAWTGDNGQLGASRHWFDSDQACLACLYLSTSQQKSRLDQLTELTGLEKLKIIELITHQTPLDDTILQEIFENKGYPIEALGVFKGLTIEQFYSKAVCGGILLNFINQNETEALVPLAHQSVLAGVFLAADVVKEALGMLDRDQPVETKMQVLGRPNEYLNQRLQKTINPKCICQDDDYLAVYSQKYNS